MISADQTARPARRRCVFTSAGDRNAVAGWLPQGGERDFDLLVAFYGDDDARFAELSRLADRAWRIKGGKAQNLRALVLAGEIDLSPYSHVWLPDDDLLLDPRDIPRLFDLAESFGFAVCQPAFDRLGRVTWPVTAVARHRDQVRLTDFVEVTCPLFRRTDLQAFLRVFDGSLSGWGLDLWFAHALGAETPGRFGIIDAVTVFNPHERQKPGEFREIDRLRPLGARIAEYRAAAARFGLPAKRRGACFGVAPLPPGWRGANPPHPDQPRPPHPSDPDLSAEEEALLARALSPAPALVVQWGLDCLAAAALGAGAAAVVALKPEQPWLRSCLADPVFAAAHGAGRLILAGDSRPPHEAEHAPGATLLRQDALAAAVRAAIEDRDASAGLIVAPAKHLVPTLRAAERLVRGLAAPPAWRVLLTGADAGAARAGPWVSIASAGRFALVERRPRAERRQAAEARPAAAPALAANGPALRRAV